jgi:hypothetical protein
LQFMAITGEVKELAERKTATGNINEIQERCH